MAGATPAGLKPWRTGADGIARMYLAGDTASPTGLVAMRVRFALKGANDSAASRVHAHLASANITVLKGTMVVGFGGQVAYGKVREYGPGSFIVIPSGEPHYEWYRGTAFLPPDFSRPPVELIVAVGEAPQGGNRHRRIEADPRAVPGVGGRAMGERVVNPPRLCHPPIGWGGSALRSGFGIHLARFRLAHLDEERALRIRVHTAGESRRRIGVRLCGGDG